MQFSLPSPEKGAASLLRSHLVGNLFRKMNKKGQVCLIKCKGKFAGLATGLAAEMEVRALTSGRTEQGLARCVAQSWIPASQPRAQSPDCGDRPWITGAQSVSLKAKTLHVIFQIP